MIQKSLEKKCHFSFMFVGEKEKNTVEKNIIVQKNTLSSRVLLRLNRLDTQLAASLSLAPNECVKPLPGAANVVLDDSSASDLSSGSHIRWSLSMTFSMLTLIMSTTSSTSEATVETPLQLLRGKPRTYLKIKRQTVFQRWYHQHQVQINNKHLLARNVIIVHINWQSPCIPQHLQIKFVSITILHWCWKIGFFFALLDIHIQSVHGKDLKS